MSKTEIDRNAGSRFRSVAGLITASVITVGMACLAPSPGASAQSASPAPAPQSGPYTPDATIAEIMQGIVMPSAQALWDAVAVYVTTSGTVASAPETDQEWEHLRWSAIALAEATNSLIIPGRAVDEPAAVVHDEDYELAPEEIAALIEQNRQAWIGYAHVLHETAMRTLSIVDAHDTDALLEIGGSIDAACEACHRQFWYPE